MLGFSSSHDCRHIGSGSAGLKVNSCVSKLTDFEMKFDANLDNYKP